MYFKHKYTKENKDGRLITSLYSTILQDFNEKNYILHTTFAFISLYQCHVNLIN